MRRDVSLGLRLEKDMHELLKSICNARGEDMADFIRRATKKEMGRMGYLQEDEIKALEVK